jgi:hypothetical protein
VQHPLQILGLTLLAAIVVVGAVAAIKSAAPPVNTGSVASPSFSLSGGDDQVGGLFIGDSDAAGIGLSTGAAGSFACRTAVLLNWSCTLDAEGGTGYVANGHTVDSTYGPYASRLAHDAAQAPTYVVITGGRSDPGGAATDSAAGAYVRAAATAFPSAKLIVVGPFLPQAGSTVNLRHLRDALERSAAAVNATFIDALAADWAMPADDYASNGVDLTTDGQALLAKKLADAIETAFPTASLEPSASALTSPATPSAS